MANFELTRNEILELKNYIESREQTIDGEWGQCRNYLKLIRDGKMPEIYNRLNDILYNTKEK